MANPMREYHVPDDDFMSFEPLAFAVLDAGTFMTPELTLAHELGHLMGAQHNADARDAVTPGAIPASSYGFMNETPTAPCKPWMTIMSIRESRHRNTPGKCVTCNRPPLWSYDESSTMTCGQPVGSNTANNRKTIDLTATSFPVFAAVRHRIHGRLSSLNIPSRIQPMRRNLLHDID